MTAHIYQGHKASSDYPCGICDEEVGDDDDGIYCESGCDLWYHRTCTGMTVGAYKLLTTEVGVCTISNASTVVVAGVYLVLVSIQIGCLSVSMSNPN